MILEVRASKPNEVEKGIQNGMKTFNDKLKPFIEAGFPLPSMEFNYQKVGDSIFKVKIKGKGLRWLIKRKLKNDFIKALEQIDSEVVVREVKKE